MLVKGVFDRLGAWLDVFDPTGRHPDRHLLPIEGQQLPHLRQQHLGRGRLNVADHGAPEAIKLR
jgi:hypothetical protein